MGIADNGPELKKHVMSFSFPVRTPLRFCLFPFTDATHHFAHMNRRHLPVHSKVRPLHTESLPFGHMADVPAQGRIFSLDVFEFSAVVAVNIKHKHFLLSGRRRWG